MSCILKSSDIVKGNLDLKKIADSGQCFRMEYVGGKAQMIAGEQKLILRQKEDKSIEITAAVQPDEEMVKRYGLDFEDYFDLDTDYERIGELIMTSDDDYLKRAYEYGKGIRILKQDLFETIISFLISQNNNIPRIKKSVNEVAMLSGREAGFFRPEDIDAALRLNDKKNLFELFSEKRFGLGYRAEYLAEMYEFTANNSEWLEELKKADHGSAFEMLKQHKGIGPKVANCICLFSLHHVDAFPIDTHIRQILDEHYPRGFDFDRYEGVSGIVQQYMFYYELSLPKKR